MDVEATRTIGKQLKRIREERGLRQEDIANDLGKHQSYVSKIESGEKSLHVYEVFRYADALKTPRGEVLGNIEQALTGKKTIAPPPSHYEYGTVSLPEDC